MKYHSLKLAPLLVTAFIVFDEVAISFNSVLLPNIKSDFMISDQLVQLSLAFGLFALGFAGLIYGGLADVFGRRPMLLISLVLFSIMTLASAVAPNTEIFLLTRFLQGLGAGAGWVVGNSCLNDIYKGKEYAKIMNYVHAIAGITPAVAPIIGSYLGVLLGWRNCFHIVFILTAFLALFMFLFQAETLKETKTITVNKFFKDYYSIFHNKNFVKYTIVKVLAVMMIFCEIANISLIFVNHYQINPMYYGFYIFPVFFVYVLASVMSSKIINHIDIDAVLKIGLILLMVSNLLIVILYLFNRELNIIAIQTIKAFSYAGWGLIFGNATAEIVSSAPGKAGMASAVMIALEMLFSSIGIYLLGFFFNGTIIPLSMFLAVFSAVAIIPLMKKQKQYAHAATPTQ